MLFWNLDAVVIIVGTTVTAYLIEDLIFLTVVGVFDIAGRAMERILCITAS